MPSGRFIVTDTASIIDDGVGGEAGVDITTGALYVRNEGDDVVELRIGGSPEGPRIASLQSMTITDLADSGPVTAVVIDSGQTSVLGWMNL